jgi:hypothetical protein
MKTLMGRIASAALLVLAGVSMYALRASTTALTRIRPDVDCSVNFTCVTDSFCQAAAGPTCYCNHTNEQCMGC